VASISILASGPWFLIRDLVFNQVSSSIGGWSDLRRIRIPDFMASISILFSNTDGLPNPSNWDADDAPFCPSLLGRIAAVLMMRFSARQQNVMQSCSFISIRDNASFSCREFPSD
jgi:hypothetical protein